MYISNELNFFDNAFLTFKPNDEKSRLSVLYRGAINWNAMKADIRNMPFKDFNYTRRNI